MGGVGASSRESLVAVFTLKRLPSCVDLLVLFQVMFEYESFVTVATFEFTLIWAILVVGH